MNEVLIIRLWLLTAFHANIPIILITNKFYEINKKESNIKNCFLFLVRLQGFEPWTL